MTAIMRAPRLLLAILLFVSFAFPQPRPAHKKVVHAAVPQTDEQQATAYFNRIKGDPLALRAFLLKFPKGGDLHNHFSGAIYAEDYIQWAADSGMCVDTAKLAFTAAEKPGTCNDPATQRSAADALKDSAFYRTLVDALSERNLLPGENPEYHFFGTFARFGAVSSSNFRGEMLAEILRRAAAENVLYLELMLTPDSGWWAKESAKIQGPLETRAQLAAAQSVIAKDAPAAVAISKKNLDQQEARARELLGCKANPQAPGCGVIVKYLYEVYRNNPPEKVFTQVIAGMEIASHESRVLGINFVQPEENYVAVRDYDLQMQMLDYAHGVYPKVHITLHAGELAFGMVKPEVLGTHIPKAIDTGHAERIGHGTDVMYYSDPAALLAEMKQKNIAVEICLTSNDLTLGVRGKQHPLRQYLDAGVPVVLATDDAGVSRSDLTHEFQRAVEEHGVTYGELETMARNSLVYSFFDSDCGCEINAPPVDPNAPTKYTLLDKLNNGIDAFNKEMARRERDAESAQKH